ncbi:MAG: hypothetical protein H6975_01470 [Gammaproteobacteria bacterium]|nr:hypothetical protein [Gammaproteobacteria bacterium]
MNQLKKREYLSVPGALLWVVGATGFYIGAGNYWHIAALIIGSLLLEESSPNKVVKEGVLGRIWLVFFIFSFVGLAQLAREVGGYYLVITKILSNHYVYFGSCGAVIIHSLYLVVQILDKRKAKKDEENT